jgi:hypothetical protein
LSENSAAAPSRLRFTRSDETSSEVVSSRGDAPAARLWAWVPPAFLASTSLVIASLAVLRPGDARNVTAIFPPWWTAEQSLIAASSAAPVLGAGSFPFMVAVKGGSPDVEESLRAAGAVLIVDGRRFRFCGTKL